MPRQTYKPEAKSSYRSPRFHNVGDSFTGLFLREPVTRQKTKFGTSDKEWWDEEKTRPRMEHVYDFLLVSETEHPSYCHFCKKIKKREDEDNGARRLYASDKQHQAIQNAFRSVDEPELYGPLTLTFTAEDEAKKQPNKEAPKLWAAEYRNPTDAEVDLCDEHLGADEPPITQPKSQGEIMEEFESLLSGDPKLSLDEMKNLVE